MEDLTLIMIAILILFLFFCLTIVFLLHILGITKKIEVGAGSPPIGKVTVAYKFGKGPYKNSGDLFTEVYKFAPHSKPIGIYYDNPKMIPAEKLRYCVGAILSEGNVKVEQELLDTMLAEGFKVLKLPKVAHCVKTSFPYVNIISCLIAVWRVYPKLSEYITDNALCAYPFLEIYSDTEIQFMAPLSQQEDFFVPEAKEHIPEEYANNANDESQDDSLLDLERDDASRSSRETSASSYTRSYVSSRFETENFSDEEESDNENDADASVQDSEISSSVDPRPSKACTNLLDEAENQDKKPDDVHDHEEVILMTDDLKENSTSCADDSSNLHDSGVCSGRTSASPNESKNMTDIPNTSEVDGNDSSSSFEEIKMEQVEKEASESQALKA